MAPCLFGHFKFNEVKTYIHGVQVAQNTRWMTNGYESIATEFKWVHSDIRVKELECAKCGTKFYEFKGWFGDGRGDKDGNRVATDEFTEHALSYSLRQV